MSKGTRIGLGILVIILIALIFSVEIILAGLRMRDLDVRLILADAAGATITVPTSTPIPRVTNNPRTPTITPTPSVLIAVEGSGGGLAPNGTVRIEVAWNYRIGPTFPKTTIRVEAISEQGQFVAVSQYVVDCGSASLECRGSHQIALVNGVKEGKGQRIDWPPGEYQIRVSQRVAGLASEQMLLERVTVNRQ